MQKRKIKELNDYKIFSKIKIEIIPCEDISGPFINILEGYEQYFHIYFDNNEEEITKTYLDKKENIKNIIIIIDYEVKSLNGLFFDCRLIKSINFRRFNRGNINDMSGMFSYCSS
ncbi:MAG TPA: hypothetical protein DCL14_04290, partial [Ruminococcaceae bacterium]|nr:hypothetical protein [Oscillospiraceae bacterium]